MHTVIVTTSVSLFHPCQKGIILGPQLQHCHCISGSSRTSHSTPAAKSIFVTWTMNEILLDVIANTIHLYRPYKHRISSWLAISPTLWQCWTKERWWSQRSERHGSDGNFWILDAIAGMGAEPSNGSCIYYHGGLVQIFLFNWVIFGFHVSFRGSIWFDLYDPPWN